MTITPGENSNITRRHFSRMPTVPSLTVRASQWATLNVYEELEGEESLTVKSKLNNSELVRGLGFCTVRLKFNKFEYSWGRAKVQWDSIEQVWAWLGTRTEALYRGALCRGGTCKGPPPVNTHTHTHMTENITFPHLFGGRWMWLNVV